MSAKKVFAIVGTRPEAIKMAPVIHALRERGVDCLLCVTAQHREMLDQVLQVFDLVPFYDLNLMRSAQTPAGVAGRILERLPRVLREHRPDWVFVHGDTTTTFASALSAFYEGIPVAHVEAGLRTGDMRAPWPEEMNRRAVAPLAELHFAPTIRAADNLEAEGIRAQIFVTGNTVVDALKSVAARLEDDRQLRALAQNFLPAINDNQKVILVTGHRRESFGAPLTRICRSLARIADIYHDVNVVYCVHPNPEVQSIVEATLTGHPRVTLLPPLDYLSFVSLMLRSYLIVTDSGGIQEEAPSLGKPVLVTRMSTERPEGVESGALRLVGDDGLEKAVSELIADKQAYERMSRATNPYGDGKAAQRIAQIFDEYTANRQAFPSRVQTPPFSAERVRPAFEFKS